MFAKRVNPDSISRILPLISVTYCRQQFSSNTNFKCLKKRVGLGARRKSKQRFHIDYAQRCVLRCGSFLCDILFSEEAQTKRKGVEVSVVYSGNKVS